MYEKWKTTITTTVKAAGEAFAELDTIVVVAYVDCIIVVVSLQLCLLLFSLIWIAFSSVLLLLLLLYCEYVEALNIQQMQIKLSYLKPK